MSVMRGLVISGILLMLLPAMVSADSIWFAMPITEPVVMVYAAATIRKYTNAMSGDTSLNALSNDVNKQFGKIL